MMDYLIIFAVWVLFVERLMYCNYVVDDVFHIKKIRADKLAFKYGEKSLLYYIRSLTYGAGAFANVKLDYLLTATIHLVNCFLILKMSSFVPALLYLINPVNNQTAIWLNGRRYALSILSVLLVWNFKWLAIVLFPFAAWIHVSALAMPILFMWTKYWLMLFASVPIAIYLCREHIDVLIHRKTDFTDNNELHRLTPWKAVIYVKSVGYYFFHCLLPFQPSMYHNFLYYFGAYDSSNKKAYSFDFDFFKGVGVLAFLGYAIIWQHNFWAFWFLLFISQWCNIYTVTMNAADRYCSLANVGLMILLSQYIAMLPQPYSIGVLYAFITFYVVKYIPLFHAYTSLENFYLYHVNLIPNGVKQVAHLARYYISKNDLMSAYALLKRALRYNPIDYELLMESGNVLFRLNKQQHALNVFAIAEKHVRIGEEKENKEFFDGLRATYPKKEDGEVKAPIMNRETRRKLERANRNNNDGT